MKTTAEPPFISVVIASVNGAPSILKCLDALVSQQGDVPYEILVMDRCGESVRQAIAERFPQPQVLVAGFEGMPSIPKLRALGMARARGAVVAILEDHCNVNPKWMTTAFRLHESGQRVMGGPVENGATSLVDWAVFYVEYARFMPPVPFGVVDAVAGSSALYDRALLETIGPELKDDVWESFMHQRMKEMGVDFWCEPDLRVIHDKEFGFGYFMSQRYHYSRAFAGMRLAGAPAWKRLAYAAATPLLPPLLVLRMARLVLPKPGHASRFAATLPLVLTFMASYAWGEAVGALLGPGDSLARVE